MKLDSISPIIELEDSLHILKLTEVIKPQIKTKTEMSEDIIERAYRCRSFGFDAR